MKTVFTNFKNKTYAKKENNVNSALDFAWKNTLDALKLRVDDDVMDKWFYRFSIVKVKRNLVVFRYTGDGDMEEFDEKWRKIFSDCFFTILGYETEIKIEKVRPAVKKKNRHVRKLGAAAFAAVLVCLAAAVIVLGMSYIGNLTFDEDFYQVGSGKVSGNLRIIQLSDLHSSKFGKDNDNLVERITLLKPDLIVTTGDMVDKHGSSDTFVKLCKRLSDVAPVYAVYGNNEDDIVYKSHMTRRELDKMTGKDPKKLKKSDDKLRAALESAGVTVLLNEQTTVEIGENTVDIYGVLTTNPSAFWNYNKETYDKFLNDDTSNFKLMLCHEPYIFETFGDGYWGDLILAGHTHGGIIRIPYMGGLYERKNGIFPERKTDTDAYIAGKYDIMGKTLIVSRGLTNRGFIRIGNKPELVIIDVNRY